MKTLLVYPSYPASFWSYKYALEFIGKRSSMPPLGLLTIAALFPGDGFEFRLVDMNVEPLTDTHLEWADIVMASSMVAQKESLYGVIRRTNASGKPIILGGPHPTSYHQDILKECGGNVDHFLLGEAEEIFPDFLKDFQGGNAQKIYETSSRPDITKTPVPRYDLLKLNQYGSMALQFSRGCPFGCEFCDITELFGRRTRTKTNAQIIAELQALYDLGWRGSVFIVDDNFIGNKRAATDLLPDIARWQENKDFPFFFFTEASVNLAKMEPLMDAMVAAGFKMVFVGIETPNPKVLLRMAKKQNIKRSAGVFQEDFLLQAVRKIQNKGLEVTAGFILGFDGEGEDQFDAQLQFIQEAGIPEAMVGLLTSFKGTDLYRRLKREGRLLKESSGANDLASLNFVPMLDREILVDGYKRVLMTLYDPKLKNYFERCLTLFENLKPSKHAGPRVGFKELRAGFRSLYRLFLSRQGPAYARFLWRVLRHHPSQLHLAVRLAIKGRHLERTTSQMMKVERYKEYLRKQLERLLELLHEYAAGAKRDLVKKALRLYRKAYARYHKIDEGFRIPARDALLNFRESVLNLLRPAGIDPSPQLALPEIS